MTDVEILDCLRTYYQRPRYVAFAELRTGTGYNRGSEQRIDFWCMDCYPSNYMEKISFEIKVSRQDFLSEIKKPQKRRLALMYSNLFYFVTPKGLIKKSELPIECGLIEIIPIKTENKCLVKKEIVKAPFRESKNPTWFFMASVFRTLQRQKDE